MKSSNIFTVDTEDWFQVFYSFDDLNPNQWNQQISKIESMVESTLHLLQQHYVTATFFCVGRLAESHPHVIKRIASAGHEIACHGYNHMPCSKLSLEQFKEDTRKAKIALEKVIGRPIHGYRAPGFSLTPTNQDYLKILSELGFKYDSSLLSSQSKPYLINENFYEVPPIGLNFLGQRLPTFGGFFFRFTPFFLMNLYFKIHLLKGGNINFYTHTWEIEPDFPRIIKHPIKAFVQYFNLKRVRNKLNWLLSRYSFTSIETFLTDLNSKDL